MGWRFRRRLKILPGIAFNFSKSGMSTSAGWRGYHKTFSKKGVRTTGSIPRYRYKVHGVHAKSSRAIVKARRTASGGRVLRAVIALPYCRRFNFYV